MRLFIYLKIFLIVMLFSCDVEYTGSKYHFTFINKTRSVINASFGETLCGQLEPGDDCSASYTTPPTQIVVKYQSAVLMGVQTEYEQMFTPDVTKEFDYHNLILGEENFSLWIRNSSVDSVDEVTGDSIDYQFTGIAISYDGTDFSEEFNFTSNIDNDDELYFMGIYDRKDFTDEEDVGVLKFRMNLNMGDPLEWSVDDLTSLITMTEADGSYYCEVHFFGPNINN